MAVTGETLENRVKFLGTKVELKHTWPLWETKQSLTPFFFAKLQRIVDVLYWVPEKSSCEEDLGNTFLT